MNSCPITEPVRRDVTLLHSYANWLVLHEMGDTSLVGTVDLMTGEKDPRNLMLVFSILKVIMVEWDISNHVEVGFFFLIPMVLT